MEHKRIHTGEKPFVCGLCNRGFTQSHHLIAHKRRHNGEKPYACKVCGKRFTEAYGLTSHMQSHTGEKPYCCHVCGKGYACPSALTAHIRVHTGERPFQCDVCSKGFTTSGNLSEHRRIHTGERPFVCHICGRGFKQSHHLRGHMKTNCFRKLYALESRKKEPMINSEGLFVQSEDGQLVCKICAKHFHDPLSFSDHVKGHFYEVPIKKTKSENSKVLEKPSDDDGLPGEVSVTAHDYMASCQLKKLENQDAGGNRGDNLSEKDPAVSPQGDALARRDVCENENVKMHHGKNYYLISSFIEL